MTMSNVKRGLIAILILLCAVLTCSEARAFNVPGPMDLPPFGTILINNGAEATISSTVTLNLSAVDESGPVTLMRFSNNNSIWSAWYPYATTKVWTLAGGGGIYTVYAQFQDSTAHSSAVVSDTIIVDSVAPYAASILINGGAAATNSTNVTLTLSATDNRGIVSDMRFSYDDVHWSAWYPYAISRAWTLTAGDGTRRIYVKFRDAVGNVSNSASDTITLDQTIPTGTVSINGGAATTSQNAVTLSLLANDNSGAVSQMRFSNDNYNWSAWYSSAPTKSWTLSAGAGSKTVYAQFQDAVGNISTIVNDSIIIDQTGPIGTVSINNGAALTNAAAVTLTLSATDNYGTVYQMRFSNDNVNWSPWAAYATTQAWTFAAVDGTRTIYAQFRDAAANVSTAASDTITLDLTKPTGTVSFNAGAAATNSTAVTLTPSATDNSGTVSKMRFSSDNVNWSLWVDYAPAYAWTLCAGDGIKTVYAQFGDAAGNISTSVSDTITIDQKSPSGNVSINNGAAVTNATAVTFTLSAADNGSTVSHQRFSSDNVNWSIWSAYAPSQAWTFAAGDGIKTIHVQYRDAVGNISTSVSDTIMLDQTRPIGTISINNGAASTNSTAITFNLSATDNSGAVSQMRFSYDNAGWSAWSAYASTKAWTITAGDGLRTVYVQFKDAAGNVSISASDTITLDSIRPTGTISINNGAALTNSTVVTFNLSATDNSGAVSQMRFSYDNAGWSAWSAYASTKPWTISAGEGLRTVYVQFKDAAGNISTSASDTITLDSSRPTGAILINAGVASTNSTAVTLNLNATDNSGTVSQMRFSYDNAGWSAWSAYAATKGATLLPGEGVKTIYAQFKDEAGNISNSASDTIIFTASISVAGRVATPYNAGIPNVTVSVNTTPAPRTAITDSNGNYLITNIPAGSYQLTPGVTGANGAAFSPSTRNITIGTSNMNGQDFKGKVTYTVSGTVNYSGAKTGRVHLDTTANGVGTSISAPGAFVIRGIEPGTFAITAFMDHLGTTDQRSSSPTGWAEVTVGSSNVTGVSITLTDPAPSIPTPPQILSVSPAEGAAFILWNAISDPFPDAYNIYYGTSPSVSPVNGTKIGPITPLNKANGSYGYLLKGLTNGSTLYFVMESINGAHKSLASNVHGPVTIGPGAGGNTVTGIITASGFTPTGSLIVRLSDEAGARVYSTVKTSPTVSQPYSITGVPNGIYFLQVFFDMNNNGFFDGGDLTNASHRYNDMRVLVNSNIIKNATIDGANYLARFIARSNSGVFSSLEFRLDSLRKSPAKLTVLSGPGLAGPTDVTQDDWFWGYSHWIHPLDTPIAGDTYTIGITYLDGTTDTITRSVTGVLNNVVTPLTPNGPVPGNTTPTFTWSSSVPALPLTGSYRITFFRNNNLYNETWFSGPIPSTALSAQYNFDGFATLPALTPNGLYSWYLSFEDQYGNENSFNGLNFAP